MDGNIPIEFNCGKFKIEFVDSYSLLMLWEEGCFFQRLYNEHQLFPEAASILSLVTIPYCALIEHDSIRFIREKCGINLPYEGERINLLRNKLKYLDSRGDIKQYLSDTQVLSKKISRYFRNHKGPLGPLANAIQPDVGIFYYKGVPIGSTHSFARYLENELFGDNTQAPDKNPFLNLGEQVGQSAAFLYLLPKFLFPEQANTIPLEFKTRSNDTKATALVKKTLMMGGGKNSIAIFHLCSELMFQINALAALADTKIITRRLWLKLIIVSLYHGCNSIQSLINFFHAPFNGAKIGEELEEALKRVFFRETRKRIQKIRAIRNALVHYDFERLNLKGLQKDSRPDHILTKAIEQTLGCEFEEFEYFLSEAAINASARINDMLAFPEFNLSKEPA
jgi:hypothetical protein